MSVIELVRNFLIENDYIEKDENLDPNDSLLEQGIIDSVGIMKLVTVLEETYEIDIEDDDLMPENFDSLAAIENYVNSRISEE